MAYEKQNFIDGQVLTANQLNHMEEGIEAAFSSGGGGGGETPDEYVVLFNKTFETAVLSTTAYNDFLLRSTGELPRADETTLLRQEQGAVQAASSEVFFEIEKELAFTDSTEIIE